MKRILRSLFFAVLMLAATVSANAAVSITSVKGWFESGYVTWQTAAGQSYDVYVRPEGGTYAKLDKELVRNYGSYGRADMVGLKAGNYQFKVVASNGDEAESNVFTAVAHDRNGFAHYNRSEGVGAYNNDGTLKANARVLYVTANNAKTVSLDMQTDSKGTMSTRTGLQDIIQAYEKGQEKRPLAVRIIGTIKKGDMDSFGSSAEGLQVKGNGSSKAIANLTIEGIGNDATIHGFGILCRSISSVEFRNFAIMLCMDDCLSLDTDNKNIWIHNMDFYYGGTGGDADQAKGDGTVDIKGKSSHVTVSYNHFFDSGKCSLGGMKSETTDCWMTYHHNWFDHSDSRHPRIRTAFYHCYNNYYDGNAKYGVGVTSGGSSFVESNYFRNCKYPMLSSKQGTDAEGDGTFSGEASGVNKAFNNKIINPKKVQYWSAEADADGKWDAVLVETRDDAVSQKAYSGGTSYNNEADAEARKAVPASAIDAVENVALICRGEFTGREGLGAGRIDGDSFKWTFDYINQDANYAVITELKSEVVNYKSTLVGFFDGTILNNGGATAYVDGGDGKGKTQAIDEHTPAPSWGADVPEDDTKQKLVIGGIEGDYFWFNAANDAQTQQYIADGVITWSEGCSYGTDKAASSSDGTFVDPKTGAITLVKSTGAVTFYHADYISMVDINYTRSGSTTADVLASADGISFQKVGSFSSKVKGNFSVKQSLPDDMKYVRILNTSGGTLYVHGIKVYAPGEEEPDERQASDLAVTPAQVSLNVGETKQLSYTSSSTGAVSYASSNTKVATVENGLITAVAPGTTTIVVAQLGDETYKPGNVSVAVTVTDPRAESQFAVTSAAEVSVKEGQTSQITTTGAAGAVTYTSSKTSVATVSETGLITAVAAGTAVITVADAGSENVKGATKTVSVTVTKDMTGKVVVTFNKPASGKTPVSTEPSLVSFGGTTNYKDGAYGEYAYGVKLESATEIYITPSANAEITLVFDVAAKRSYLDGEEITSDANGEYKFNGVGGKKYTLKKKDSVNLYAVIFDFKGGDDPNPPTPTDESLINFPTKHDGVEAKGSSVDSGTTIQLKNAYIGKVDGVDTPGNGIILSVKDGFKKGDVVSVAGTITVKADDASYDKKIVTTAALATITEENTADIFYTYAPFANTNQSGVGTAGEQQYTLEDDYPELWIVRSGSTTATVTLIKVVRHTSTGISTLVEVKTNGNIYTLDGRRVQNTQRGQMYIMNGKKFIAK